MSLDITTRNTQWYECHCDLGEVRVGVVVGEEILAGLSGPLKVMRQATLLAEVELVLQALEIWQDIDLDLTPVQQPEGNPVSKLDSNPVGDTTADTVHVTITHKEAPDYYPVRFELPITSLHKVKPVDAELTRVLNLSWVTLNASLVLDEVVVPDEEQLNLKQGALVLLPQSFEKTWQAKLILPAMGNVAFAGTLQLDAGSFSVASSPEVSSTLSAGSPAPLSIRLQQDIALTADILVGESDGVSVPLDLNTTPLAAHLYRADTKIGAGTIGPIGMGYALYIHTMTASVMLEIA